jgi:hypothetical protein
MVIIDVFKVINIDQQKADGGGILCTAVPFALDKLKGSPNAGEILGN